ncbi:acyl-CoA thioesterase/bile acid-CoA:amino acid N-acyltransferase family protein [Micromonospora sp. WMMD1082]|uniref:acyl-CoA thioesterase/bile acid-CoA:amino acid N-acyltransferase family protein n=1 Tax=Micromonospora sp. WMMD1082 TaxID=3016104 RepID=UPI002416129D|nr:acyl-CoA thioesterase/bile acid-CoA:amino acid N-acyltransferase family protein [Micromonospora sp. WMMD1082]MDG4796307.1 acyl-CoA thioesterase/bile acid-CoA:amino acid N-acyltransferase family protein [Micromonospora sp. WMMD1082]
MRGEWRRVVRALPAVAVALLVAATLGGDRGVGGDPRLRLDVTPAAALADEPVRVRVGGLTAGERVTVAAEAEDHAGRLWRATATFVADRNGTVDLSQDASSGGSYSGVDPMGLFWSMDPVDGDASYFAPSLPQVRPDFTVRLSATAGGRGPATAAVRRDWTAGAVTFTELTTQADGVRGMLVLPPPDVPRRPGVLRIGGSEGGISWLYDAPLLASRGHPVLALAYFDSAGLPDSLHDIPLEYFATAAELLARHSGGEVAAVGYSRGSEAALLLAQLYPELVRAVVVYAPSNWVNPGYPYTGAAAWTWNGRPVPAGRIPVDRIDGPVLAISGADDQLWDAAAYGAELVLALGGPPHRMLLYPDAGHGVGTVPYLPSETVHQGPTGVQTYGGTRAGDAAARRDGWSQLLAFLAAA